MSDETTPEQAPLPGEQMLTETPAPPADPVTATTDDTPPETETPATEMPTVPGWSRAVVNIHKSKAEVITKEVTPAELAEYEQRFGRSAVHVLRYLEESN